MLGLVAIVLAAVWISIVLAVGIVLAMLPIFALGMQIVVATVVIAALLIGAVVLRLEALVRIGILAPALGAVGLRVVLMRAISRIVARPMIGFVLRVTGRRVRRSLERFAVRSLVAARDRNR